MKVAKDLMREDYTWLDHSDTLSHAMGTLKNEAKGEALVFKDEILTGVFSPSYMMRSKLDFMKAKVGKFARPVPSIDSQEPVEEVARMMQASGLSVLPVIERGRLLGSIHMMDVLNYFARNNNSSSLKKVHDEINPKKTFTLKESEKFGQAVQLFHQTSAYALMLTDENGKPSDLLTRYDIMRQVQFYSHRREHAGRPRMQQKAFKANLPDMDAQPLSNFTNYRTPFVLQESQTVREALIQMQEEGRLSFLLKHKDELIAMNAKDILKYYTQFSSALTQEGQRSGATESV
jgi:predicted transcriptional regulator